MSTPWERLKEERLRLAMSQEVFGAHGGVRKQAQIKYEKGDRNPDSAYFEGIASIGANVDYILTGVTSGLRTKLNALEETTKAATSLDLPPRESELVRDVLYGVAMKDGSGIRETIENYVAERQSKKPAKTAAKRSKS